jgi:hypothetical protein
MLRQPSVAQLLDEPDAPLSCLDRGTLVAQRPLTPNTLLTQPSRLFRSTQAIESQGGEIAREYRTARDGIAFDGHSLGLQTGHALLDHVQSRKTSPQTALLQLELRPVPLQYPVQPEFKG